MEFAMCTAFDGFLNRHGYFQRSCILGLLRDEGRMILKGT